MAVSKRFTLNTKDAVYIWDRAKLFLLPLAIIYIPFVVARIESDGFQWADFGLNEFELGALVLYVLNRITTTAQLYLTGKK